MGSCFSSAPDESNPKPKSPQPLATQGAKPDQAPSDPKPPAPKPATPKPEPAAPEGKDGELKVNPLDLEKLEQLGKGSSGTVRRARDPKSGKSVALKLVPLNLKDDEMEQMLQQLRDLYTSEHPHIAKFHGTVYDTQKNVVLIAFEYMDQKSLRDVMHKAGKIPENVMGCCAAQVMSGFNYLHAERRIIHRDIKPSNILCNKEGSFKIADFGMSKELSATLSAGQTWVGTSSYMSPERVGGQNYSFASDIWSLGIIMVECVTGKSPYENLKNMDMLDAIVDGDPPTLPSEASPEARDFVSLCLKKDDRQRPGADFFLNHPFIQKHEKFDASPWLSSVPGGLQC